MLPLMMPVAAGANMTFRIALCPGFKRIPAGTPVALKPGPETLVLEIVMVDWPEFVDVTVKAVLLPMSTFPKFKHDALKLKPCPLTASVLAVPTALVMPTHPEFARVTNRSNKKLTQHLFVVTQCLRPASIARRHTPC